MIANGGLDPDLARRRVLRLLGVLSGSAAVALFARAFGILAGSETTPSSSAQTPTRSAVRGSAPPPTTAQSNTTTSSSTSTMPTTTTTETVIVVTVISRAGWGATPARDLEPHTPVRLTYHHTAASGSDVGRAPERIRAYQAYHIDQGWPDVAYHFLIDQAGRIYQGRSPDARGDTFTQYDPTGHFLPCLDGNFDEEQPSTESVAALVLVMAWACQRYGIDPLTLRGHRDYASTSCPGDSLYALRNDIERDLSDALQTGAVFKLAFVDDPV